MSVIVSAVSAEWTKLWTTRTVWWAFVAAVVMMAAGAGQYSFYAGNGDLAAATRPDGLVSVGTIAGFGMTIAQFALIALAMLVMTGEYSAGTIRATLAWIPSRGRLLVAKSVVVAAVTFVAGVCLGLIGGLVAAALLGDEGDTAVAGLLGHALAIGGYLAVMSVFTIGLAATLRGPVTTLVAVLLLVVVIPPILTLPDNPALNHVADALPGVAGSHFVLGDSDPYPAVVGLLIVAVWAFAALLAGWRVLAHRDA